MDFYIISSITFRMDTDPGAIQKILDIGERIIQALDDPTIFQRYTTIKEKIMEDYKHSSSPQMRKLIIENQDLSERINQLNAQYSQDNYLKTYIISQIELIQTKIIPNVTRVPFVSVEEASSSLMEVLNTKLMSHQFLKQKLADENEKLKQAIQDMRNSSLSEIDRIKKRRIEISTNWQKKEKEIADQLNEIGASIIEYNAKMPSDTEMLKKQLNSIIIDEKPRDKAEAKLNDIELKRNKLRSQVQKLRFAIQKINLEIEGLKKVQISFISDE